MSNDTNPRIYGFESTKDLNRIETAVRWVERQQKFRFQYGMKSNPPSAPTFWGTGSLTETATDPATAYTVTCQKTSVSGGTVSTSDLDRTVEVYIPSLESGKQYASGTEGFYIWAGDGIYRFFPYTCSTDSGG